MSNTTESLLNSDATAQAAALRSGDASATALVAAALARLEQRNPELNAVIHHRAERALAEASSVDSTLAFAGVPIVVKDLGLGMKGEPFHMGVRGLKAAGFTAPVDSYTYEKLRAAGFVVIGRTNTPELGTTITTEPLAYGPSRNPWNTNHSTGGSSGGSAAAVAAGIVAVGHANDGGGSIRIPASECGLVGLKPTRGRVSSGPVVGESWMGATIDGAVTRSVRDAAAMLDVLQGPMPGDPYGAPTPLRPYSQEVGVDPGTLNIGIFCGPQPGYTVDPECVAAFEKTASLLASMGHNVTEAAPGALTEPEFSDRFVTILIANLARDIADLEAVSGRTFGADDLEPENAFYALLGQSLTASAYLEAVNWMHSYQRRMASWWTPGSDGGAGFDILLTPTIGTTPPLLGWISDPTAEPGNHVRTVMQFTAQFNITGQPAVSLPMHVSADGLPVGIQLVAAFGREDLLIRVASQCESAAPWAHLAPNYH